MFSISSRKCAADFLKMKIRKIQDGDEDGGHVVPNDCCHSNSSYLKFDCSQEK